MQSADIGPHRVRRRGVLDQHWKGRFLGFKKNKIEGMVAIVQHVYSLLDIHVCFDGERKGLTSNCKILPPLFILLNICPITSNISIIFCDRHLSIFFN